MTLNRCPSEETHLKSEHAQIDKDPNQMKNRTTEHWLASSIRIQNPRDVCHFIDETNEEQNDDNMIVECTTQCSIKQKMIENEESAENRDDIQEKVGPKSKGGGETII